MPGKMKLGRPEFKTRLDNAVRAGQGSLPKKQRKMLRNIKSIVDTKLRDMEKLKRKK